MRFAPWTAAPAVLLALSLGACGGGESTPQPSLKAPDAQTAGDELLGAGSARGRAEGDAAGGEAERDGSASSDGKAPAAGDEGGKDGRANAEAGEPARGREVAGEEDAVRSTLRAFVRAVNARDPSVCNRLVTANYLKQATGLSGSAALRRCRRDIAGARGVKVTITEIEGIRVEGSSALVKFTATVGESAGRQIYRLEKSGDRWRIDGDGSADAAR